MPSNPIATPKGWGKPYTVFHTNDPHFQCPWEVYSDGHGSFVGRYATEAEAKYVALALNNHGPLMEALRKYIDAHYAERKQASMGSTRFEDTGDFVVDSEDHEAARKALDRIDAEEAK